MEDDCYKVSSGGALNLNRNPPVSSQEIAGRGSEASITNDQQWKGLSDGNGEDKQRGPFGALGSTGLQAVGSWLGVSERKNSSEK